MTNLDGKQCMVNNGKAFLFACTLQNCPAIDMHCTRHTAVSVSTLLQRLLMLLLMRFHLPAGLRVVHRSLRPSLAADVDILA